jgi:hypothetical protein
LVREAGIKTGLLPAGTELSGRVKSIFSIHEKLEKYNRAKGDERLPLIQDIFAIRGIFADLADHERMAYLIRKTFRTLREAWTAIDIEPEYVGRQDPRLDKNYDFRFFYDEMEEPRYHYLRAMEEEMDGFLVRRGYVDGEKDCLSRPPAGGAPYHYLIRATYDYFPLEIQLATRELHEKTEKEKPHWYYKYNDIFSSILGKYEMEDCKVRDDVVYVVVVNEKKRKFAAGYIPKKRAFAANFPGYEIKPAEMEWDRYRAGVADIDRIENGYILFKPISSPTP